MGLQASDSKSNHEYKMKYPGQKYYDLENYSTKSQNNSPCMSLFWHKIPIRINWLKVFNTINQENTIIEEHDEKPEEPEE